MRVIIHSVLALAAVLPTQAFTNGTLIPAYFCNPVPDGMPKSLGELIPFTKKDICADLAFNNNATANLKVVPVTGKQPGNTGYMLASFRKYSLIHALVAIAKVCRQYTKRNPTPPARHGCYSRSRRNNLKSRPTQPLSPHFKSSRHGT